MRRMGWVVIVVLGACTTQPMERGRRWPHHRKETDTRFAELERRAEELEKKNSDLTARMSELAQRLRTLEAASTKKSAADVAPAGTN